ncbi:hypothetical protein [Vibrio metoecus]|uniref:hypothetical protein n=1 Tax=Vibrio metoecus TaxID=1481663 RepID=UPI0019D6744F|nr:hypothetical protein [Vibrio metoecus]
MILLSGNQKGNAGLELKKLKISTRNKVRAVTSSKEKESIQLMNYLRENCSVAELYQAESAIRALSSTNYTLPELFPDVPQVKEKFIRLKNLGLEKELSYIDNAVKSNIGKIESFLDALSEINKSIYQNNLIKAENLIYNAISEFGYSHLLLRKTIFVMSQSEHNEFEKLNKIIATYGIRSNAVNTLLYCYKEEQDYLSVKRSVMSTKDKGEINKFTRDILRIGFHPHAKDSEDLSQLIQSCLQSSLIDAIFIIKVNKSLIDTSKYQYINYIFNKINDGNGTIIDIASIYSSYKDPEDVFFQRSSAWLENDDIVEYRFLIDHFNDSPESSYFSLTDELLLRVKNNINISCIEDIVDSNKDITFGKIKLFEKHSLISNSALFNLVIHMKEGMIHTTENTLIKVMEITRDLARTVNVKFIKTFLLGAPSELSKIIILLLIIKRSKNEADNFNLRRTLQNHLISNYNSDLLSFIKDVANKSLSVAEYTYEVCTEDFISKLSHIISTTEQITETRANLHSWMGESTGDSSYTVRAKNLRIDHKINLVKNELDDNRIYVDTQKFLEWMQDEIAQDLTTALTLSPHDKEEGNPNEVQIVHIISRCYSEFCSNNLFGIASYLGRRLRHGTFKGQLYYSVVNGIEKEYDDVISDALISPLWNQFKEDYEKEVESIVKSKLHIKSHSKFEGFLDPEISGSNKIEVLRGCLNNIYSDFESSNNSYNSILLINEYCWRLAESDMRSINSYLKGKKANLIDLHILNEIKSKSLQTQIDEARLASFTREVHRLVNDKLTEMYGWFKKPQSVSPKASLNLLYKAVVAEVQQSFSKFEPETSFEEKDDIELMGGAYHVLYDALYVIVYNAAKHGKPLGKISRSFSLDKDDTSNFVRVKFDSEILDSSNENQVNELLRIDNESDIDDAQLHEKSSGIKKLFHLQKYDKSFQILNIKCIKRKVCIEMIYRLGHI